MLGLYVHLPWCVRKCPYCDFNSHAVRGGFDEAAYINRLLDDLGNQLVGIKEPISTVYFGGGTPSLFQPSSFARLLEHPALVRAKEITMEANPGTMERDQFRRYRDAGITRVSIGTQSFCKRQLQVLGRIHSADESVQAITEAVSAGFDSVNVDLMYGLPSQSIDEAVHDLETAIELNPQHLSWYQLTIEPNTGFAKKPPKLPSLDYLADMSERGHSVLESCGFERYEVSAFARDKKWCRHNVNYWEFGDYLGIGAGAHGKYTEEGTVIRTAQPKQPSAYLTGKPIERMKVPTDQLPVEYMMNVLRLKQGIDRTHFCISTGLKFKVIRNVVEELVDWRLMQSDRLQLTERGYKHLDSVVNRFTEIKDVDKIMNKPSLEK